MSAVAITVTGGDALSARLTAAPAALHAALRPVFVDIAAALRERIAAELDGEVLRKRSGRLAASVVVSSDEISASARIGGATAPYAAALEYGASIPAQLIVAKNARALAFVVGGQTVFAKRANRPAFVLPPHSFLRAALAELEPQFAAWIGEVASQAVKP